MKNYPSWIKAAVIAQLLTGVFHILGMITEMVPKNESERTLIEQMKNYKFDMGAGFIHSMDDILLAFSICFALLLLFSAAINFYLLKTCFEIKILKGIVAINIIIYIICFVTMATLTFLPPIICTGLSTVFLTYAYYLMVNQIKFH